MRRYKGRRLFSVWGLAVVLVVGCAVTAAWKLRWLPIQIGGADTGTLVSLKAMPTNAASRKMSSKSVTEGLETVEIDDITFSAQSEPPVSAYDANLDDADPFSNQTRASSRRDIGSHQWDDPTTPQVFSGPPMAVHNHNHRDDGTLDFRSSGADENGMVRVSSEVEPKNERAADQGSSPAAGRHAETADKSSWANIDLARIDRLIDSGDSVAAHRELSQIYWYQPELRPLIQKRSDATAMSIYFSPQPHYMEPYVVQPNDQLRTIAKKYHISWEYLSKLNRIDPRRIRPGQKLKVIMGPFSAFVDLSDHELLIHALGYFVRKYPIGIGKDASSPIGRFKVLNKVLNPQYTDPEGRVIDASDPNNPLGERWIDIGEGFGIHGTVDSASIGRDKSRGCIRMLNSDVSEVFDLLTVGSEIVIQH